MKRILCLLLCGALLASLAGCRRRITADSDHILYETYPENVPDPNLPNGETVPEGQPDEDQAPNFVLDSDAPPVDEETPAEGGERTEHAPDPPEKGEEITVSFDGNGGECTAQPMAVHVGATYGALPTPVRPGYEFKGWFTDPEHGFCVDATTVVTIRQDHTLYAQWSEFRGYTVTFDPNGGRISPYRAEKTVYPGETYGELPTPYRDGYLLTGWFTQPQGGEAVTAHTPFTVNQNQILYAQWEYSPMKYWAFVLENTTQRIFSCQETFVYPELEADGVTMQHCPFVERTGSQNVARNRQDPHVDDGWVKEKKPDVIVKLTSGMGYAEAVRSGVESRFPGARVLVFPVEAVDGTDAEKLYYALSLAKQLYPQYYAEIDMEKVSKELEIESDGGGKE